MINSFYNIFTLVSFLAVMAIAIYLVRLSWLRTVVAVLVAGALFCFGVVFLAFGATPLDVFLIAQVALVCDEGEYEFWRTYSSIIEANCLDKMSGSINDGVGWWKGLMTPIDP